MTTSAFAIDQRCHYCDNDSEYWDYIEYQVISVCKKHVIKEVSS